MKHSKRQLIDNSLFLYGGLVAIALTVIAFFNLKNWTSVITLILFLPVSVYFLIRIFISLGRAISSFFNTDQKRHPYFGDFSLTTFFDQSDTGFIITLTLIALAFSLIFFRISQTILE